MGDLKFKHANTKQNAIRDNKHYNLQAHKNKAGRLLENSRHSFVDLQSQKKIKEISLLYKLQTCYVLIRKSV